MARRRALFSCGRAATGTAITGAVPTGSVIRVSATVGAGMATVPAGGGETACRAAVTTPAGSAAGPSLTLVWSTGLRREAAQIAPQTASASTATVAMPQSPWSARSAAPAATSPAAGSVRPQAAAIRPAVDQCTTPPLRPRPEPITEPEQTWVVESAKPRWEEARMVAAAPVWAAKPCGGWMSVMPLPIVRMIRQPPRYVPSAMARPAEAMTHSGGSACGATTPPVISARVITPIVFWASLVPCARETSAAEAICPAR